jgi:hypothetical protein
MLNLAGCDPNKRMMSSWLGDGDEQGCNYFISGELNV